MRIINYYIRNEYGNLRERFATQGDEKVFKQLTGRTTLTAQDRALLLDLVGNDSLRFQRVEDPQFAANEALIQLDQMDALKRAAVHAASSSARARADLYI